MALLGHQWLSEVLLLEKIDLIQDKILTVSTFLELYFCDEKKTIILNECNTNTPKGISKPSLNLQNWASRCTWELSRVRMWREQAVSLAWVGSTERNLSLVSGETSLHSAALWLSSVPSATNPRNNASGSGSQGRIRDSVATISCWQLTSFLRITATDKFNNKVVKAICNKQHRYCLPGHCETKC